ncbi:MAG: hypothetical protein ACR2P7_02275 [bacterium]
MIPDVLIDVAQAITNSQVVLPSGSGDGRRDSSSAELTIVSVLQNQRRWDVHAANVGQAHNRSWYDLMLNDYYCDIKVSDLRGADNTNAKKAVYFFLTGQDPGLVPNRNDQFFCSMSENEAEDEERDFYYIVVDKSNGESFVVSLKGITVSPAHNNPPFQCKWDDCRMPVQRTWTDAREYLLGVWAQTIKNGIATYRNAMPRYYSDFFN